MAKTGDPFHKETRPHEVRGSARVSAVQIACVQVVARTGMSSGGTQTKQAAGRPSAPPQSIGPIDSRALPTTPRGPLIRESGLTPAEVLLTLGSRDS